MRLRTLLIVILVFSRRGFNTLCFLQHCIPGHATLGNSLCGSFRCRSFHQHCGSFSGGIRMSRPSTEIGDFVPCACNVFRSQFLVSGEINSFSAFPAKTSSETGSDFKQCTSCRCLLMAEKDNGRCNVFRLEFCNLANQLR